MAGSRHFNLCVQDSAIAYVDTDPVYQMMTGTTEFPPEMSFEKGIKNGETAESPMISNPIAGTITGLIKQQGYLRDIVEISKFNAWAENPVAAGWDRRTKPLVTGRPSKGRGIYVRWLDEDRPPAFYQDSRHAHWSIYSASHTPVMQEMTTLLGLKSLPSSTILAGSNLYYDPAQTDFFNHSQSHVSIGPTGSLVDYSSFSTILEGDLAGLKAYYRTPDANPNQPNGFVEGVPVNSLSISVEIGSDADYALHDNFLDDSAKFDINVLYDKETVGDTNDRIQFEGLQATYGKTSKMTFPVPGKTLAIHQYTLLVPQWDIMSNNSNIDLARFG